jgi:hypothetical protein
MKTPKRVFVVQYEQFFDADDVGDISEAIHQGLETLRAYAGARILGSYDAIDDDKFRGQAVTHISITRPINIEVD